MMNRFTDIDLSFEQLPPIYGYRSQTLVPLEIALEPIQSEIHELPYYIKTAKQHCHFPSEHGLNRDESAAVYIYTMEWGDTSLYRLLNKALRSKNRQALKIWFSYLKLFDTALEKLPTVKEVVWRGINQNIGKDFSKNQHVTWWSISSCSSSVNIIQNFLGNNKNSTIFLIEATNGKKISDYSEYKNEDEVILRMGTQLSVKGDTLEQSNGSHIVHLIEVNEKTSTPATNETFMSKIPSNKGAFATQATSSSTSVQSSTMQNLCSDCRAHDYCYYTGIIATPTYARFPPQHPNYYYARSTPGYDDGWNTYCTSYHRCNCACHSN